MANGKNTFLSHRLQNRVISSQSHQSSVMRCRMEQCFDYGRCSIAQDKFIAVRVGQPSSSIGNAHHLVSDELKRIFSSGEG